MEEEGRGERRIGGGGAKGCPAADGISAVDVPSANGPLANWPKVKDDAC